MSPIVHEPRHRKNTINNANVADSNLALLSARECQVVAIAGQVTRITRVEPGETGWHREAVVRTVHSIA
jgi:hypothetical protein